MKTIQVVTYLLMIATPLFSAIVTNINYIKYPGTEIVIHNTNGLSPIYQRYFHKYVKYQTPNGKCIFIIAQNKVSDEQLLRARNIIDFFLTDVSGTKYGSRKKAIANLMGDRKAVLIMPNGEDGDISNEAILDAGQPLYEKEFPVEGTPLYFDNEEKNTAPFEEILHMIHDNGIGTSSDFGAKPTFQREVKKATDYAISNKLWAFGSDYQDWLEELIDEGSTEQEYLAAVIDAYYGIFDFYQNDEGIKGQYITQSRNQIRQKDPKGFELLKGFFSSDITYMANISSVFSGTFNIQYVRNKPYTRKSQYLINARLTGSHNSNLTGNSRDNILMGNKGNNIIDGKSGSDIVQFEGKRSDYEIKKNAGDIVVKDLKGEEGTDTLISIETIRFTDKDIKSAEE